MATEETETVSLIGSDKVEGTSVYGADEPRSVRSSAAMIDKRSGKVSYEHSPERTSRDPLIEIIARLRVRVVGDSCGRPFDATRVKQISSVWSKPTVERHRGEKPGGVVNVDEQGALRTAALEPPVFRSVDLDQLAHAVPAIPRLVHRPQPGAAILPQTRRDHPLPNRLARQVNAVKLRELLRRQRRAKVRVALPDDADHFGTQSRPIATVARPATPS